MQATADDHSRPGWPYLLGPFVFSLVGVISFGGIVGLRPLHTAIVFECVLFVVGLLLLRERSHECGNVPMSAGTFP